MSQPSGPPWTASSAPGASYDDPDLRVSDAERAEAADRLSQHFSDGRLDQAEYNERLDQAMSAKTRADLRGLFAGLPPTEAEAAAAREAATTARDAEAAAAKQAASMAARQRRRRPFRHLVFLALVVVVAIGFAHAMAHFYLPWLLIALLAFLWLTHGPGQQRR